MCRAIMSYVVIRYLDVFQMPTQPLSQSPSSVPPGWGGRQNRVEKLVGQDKDGEIAYHLPSWASQAHSEENEVNLRQLKHI